MGIVLASQSPRRRELLGNLGLRFSVCPARGEEDMSAHLTPDKLVEALALAKAEEVAAQYEPQDVIIAADTIVVLDGAVLGKPRDRQEAVEMLTALSGRTHRVYTGVAVLGKGRKAIEHECTSVTFRTLSREEIERYIATGEPMDKAGAYGIQARGALLVEGICGDYFNVMGLPVCRLGKMLKEFGVQTL